MVRPEFCSTVDFLISRDHCSILKEVARIIETENLKFGRRNRKYHTEDTTCLDLGTALHSKKIREAGQSIHAFRLGCLVKEIMESEDSAVVHYTLIDFEHIVLEATQFKVFSPVALQLRPPPPQSKRKSPCAQVISL